MDRSTFESADPILDDMGAILDELLDSDQFSAIRLALARLSEVVGSRYSVNLNVSVEVFDPERPHALPLLTTGLSASKGKTPYKIYGDSTPQKYVVNGEMQVVPHDRCPKCYGLWDYKFKNLTCSECGATMGQEVKLLLDTDVCPWCEEGKISLALQNVTSAVTGSIPASWFGAEFLLSPSQSVSALWSVVANQNGTSLLNPCPRMTGYKAKFRSRAPHTEYRGTLHGSPCRTWKVAAPRARRCVGPKGPS